MKRKKSCTLTNSNLFFFLLFFGCIFFILRKVVSILVEKSCTFYRIYFCLFAYLHICFLKSKVCCFFAFLVNLIYIFLNIFFFSIIFVCVCFKEWMTAHKILTMLKKGVVEGNSWEEKMPRVDGVGV